MISDITALGFPDCPSGRAQQGLTSCWGQVGVKCLLNKKSCQLFRNEIPCYEELLMRKQNIVKILNVHLFLPIHTSCCQNRVDCSLITLDIVI